MKRNNKAVQRMIITKNKETTCFSFSFSCSVVIYLYLDQKQSKTQDFLDSEISHRNTHKDRRDNDGAGYENKPRKIKMKYDYFYRDRFKKYSGVEGALSEQFYDLHL